MQQKLSNTAALAAMVALGYNTWGWVTHAISVDAAIFAQNLLWTMVSFSIGSLYLWRMRKASGEAKWLMIGIACVAIGTAAHRGYYTAWRWLRENGFENAQAAQLDFAWMLLVPIAIALFGYAYHARPILEGISGGRWMVDFMSVNILVWSVAAWLLT